jgi:MFS family permease
MDYAPHHTIITEDPMTELIGIIIITLASFVTLTALLTTLTYLLPTRAKHAQQILQDKPGRAFVIGLVNLLFFGILVAVFSQGGEIGGLLGLIILLALLGLAFIGLTGLLLLLRHRFYPPHEETDHSLLAVTIRSSAVLIAGLMAPVVGWFILGSHPAHLGVGHGHHNSLTQRKQTNPDNFFKLINSITR